MSESRDLAIKLFGKTIPFPANDDDRRTEEEDKGRSDKAYLHETKDKDGDSRDLETKSEPTLFSSAKETLRTSAGQETRPMKNNLEPEEQENGTSISQEKMIKKPDKILPCPRCSSLDTKFCYYNNYNLNQPRHFCKHCQRYWTAGGTMRNVPVGAGRRKNKNLASQFRHIPVSEAKFQIVRPEVPDTNHLPTQKPNGTVLSFGSDTPLSESIASVFNCAKKKMKNCDQNGFHRPEGQVVPFHAVENGDEQSGGSSVTASNSTGDGMGANQQEPVIQNCQRFPAQLSYINGSSPWPYPWSPVPAFWPSNYPLSFYPAPAYWGCAVPSTRTIPWIPPPTSSSNGSSGAGSNSQTLGMHSREGEAVDNTDSENGDSPKLRNQERCLWIPKTLRIHDPKEAAKSSRWATMGFKFGSAYGLDGEGQFKALQKKEGLKNHTEETSQVLHANPAALSRFLNFQEIS